MGSTADDRRREMVERDLVGHGIRDPSVLDAMGRVPRHLFWHDEGDTTTAPAANAGDHSAELSHAYGDHPLPIECAQTMSQPYIVALTAELLQISATDRVLDVGTGSGYAAAVLALLADEVWSIERHPELAAAAADRLRRLGFHNVHVAAGDGSRGWPSAAPFDAIAVAAAAPEVPTALTEQLAEGGRLVVPVERSAEVQDLVLVRRTGDRLEQRTVIPVRFVPLIADPGDADPRDADSPDADSPDADPHDVDPGDAADGASPPPSS